MNEPSQNIIETAAAASAILETGLGGLPFLDTVDDERFVYRFQYRTHLRHMRDDIGEYLAPSFWNPATKREHAHYVELARTLSENQRIYSLSVWRSEAAAWRGWSRSEKIEDRVLLRIERGAFGNTSLHCIDDEHLLGEAFLLYQVGSYEDGQVYGDARIPWSDIVQTEAVWRSIQIDEEDLRAVGNPFAHNYDSGEVPPPDLGFDYGLPSDEKMLRKHILHLTWLQNKLASVPRWSIVRRWKAHAAFDAAWALWLSLDHSEPRMRAAIDRIESIMPHDHPSHRYIQKSRQLVIE